AAGKSCWFVHGSNVIRRDPASRQRTVAIRSELQPARQRPKDDRFLTTSTGASPSIAPMNLQLTPRRILGAAILASALWVVHGFIQPMLAACVIAIASWPLYLRFALCVPRRLGASAAPVLFTVVITLFVLAPMVFAAGALLSEAHTLLAEIAAADSRGIPVPWWLEGVPVVGPWAAESWHSELAHPQALLAWTRRADPAALLGWAQSLGQFTGHHVLVIGFTILLLVFLYRDGEALAAGLRRAARQAVGESSERYVDLVARGLRSSVA